MPGCVGAAAIGLRRPEAERDRSAPHRSARLYRAVHPQRLARLEPSGHLVAFVSTTNVFAAAVGLKLPSAFALLGFGVLTAGVCGGFLGGRSQPHSEAYILCSTENALSIARSEGIPTDRKLSSAEIDRLDEAIDQRCGHLDR